MRDCLQSWILAALLVVGTVVAGTAAASSVTVPDDHSTVQAAIDSPADTVFIRSGTYQEWVYVDRARVLKGLGPTRPRITTLEVNNSYFWDVPPVLHVDNLAFSEPVLLKTLYYRPRNIILKFSHCTIDSGIFQATMMDPDDIAQLEISNSVLRGSTEVTADLFRMQADTVLGSISVRTTENWIRDCRFEGNGSGIGLYLDDNPRGTIERCTFVGLGTGLFLYNSDCETVADNTFSDCDTAMYLQGGCATFERNTMLDCDRGVEFIGSYDVFVEHNTIWDVSLPIVSLRSTATVRHNVVGSSLGTGLEIYRPGEGYRVTNNTFVNLGGSGIVVREIPFYVDDIVIERNIVANTQGWGIRLPAASPLVLDCNDWYANALGAVDSAEAGLTDVSMDPQFCDLVERDLRLQKASPLNGLGACGPIGALEVGCATTSTLIAGLWVEPIENAARVRWRFTFEPDTSWIERRTGTAAAWDRVVGSGATDGNGEHVHVDRDVRVGSSYEYRIGWIEAGVIEHSPPQKLRWDEAPAGIRVFPNPSFGRVEIEWTLEAAGVVRASVYDLLGREIARLVDGHMAAGRHAAGWDGRIRGKPAAAGWYLVRIHNGTRKLSERVLMIR